MKSETCRKHATFGLELLVGEFINSKYKFPAVFAHIVQNER